MAWLISFVITGAVLVSGNILTYDRNNTVSRHDVAAPVILDETERFKKIYSFNSDGKIKISNINGSIRINSWDRNEIKVEYVKVADTKERLAALNVKINAQQTLFRIKTTYNKTKGKNKRKWKKRGKLYVNFKLTVPRTAKLDGIESINGSVTVSNMTNYSEISAVNGTVKATNLRGIANLSTVNGTVYADFGELDNRSSISLDTVNGSVKLFIPSDSNATIRAETVNGGISNEFGLPVRKGKYVGSDLHGKIGNGDVKIKLESVNGGLIINRRKDGKSLKPATNLLKKKWEDGGDKEIQVQVKTAVSEPNTDRVIVLTDAKKALAEVKKAMKIKGLTEIEIKKIHKKTLGDVKKAMETGLLTKIDMERIQNKALKEMEKATRKMDTEKLRIDLKKLTKGIREAEKDRLEALKYMHSAAFFGRSPFILEKTRSFNVKGVPTVVIKAKDCAVVVKGWDKKKIKHSVYRVRRNRSVPIYVTSENNKVVKITVKATSPTRRFVKSDQVRLEVYVPKKSNLEIHTRRELRLEEVLGNIKLKTESGAVNVRDVGGKLDLNAINKNRNRIRIVGFEGELNATVVNSDTYLEGNFEKIVANGNKSRIYLTLDKDTQATINTKNLGIKGNTKPGSKYTINGIKLINEDYGIWRIGKGGVKYTFDLADGEIFLRSQNTIGGR